MAYVLHRLNQEGGFVCKQNSTKSYTPQLNHPDVRIFDTLEEDLFLFLFV